MIRIQLMDSSNWMFWNQISSFALTLAIVKVLVALFVCFLRRLIVKRSFSRWNFFRIINSVQNRRIKEKIRHRNTLRKQLKARVVFIDGADLEKKKRFKVFFQVFSPVLSRTIYKIWKRKNSKCERVRSRITTSEQLQKIEKWRDNTMILIFLEFASFFSTRENEIEEQSYASMNEFILLFSLYSFSNDGYKWF